MLIGAAVCVVGLVATHIWAPETTGLSLTKTSRLPLPVTAPPGVTVTEKP